MSRYNLDYHFIRHGVKVKLIHWWDGDTAGSLVYLNNTVTCLTRCDKHAVDPILWSDQAHEDYALDQLRDMTDTPEDLVNTIWRVLRDYEDEKRARLLTAVLKSTA